MAIIMANLSNKMRYWLWYHLFQSKSRNYRVE